VKCSYCDDEPESRLVRVDCSTCGVVVECRLCSFRHIDHYHTMELLDSPVETLRSNDE
jgi:hypothetical protein